MSYDTKNNKSISLKSNEFKDLRIYSISFNSQGELWLIG